MNRFHLAVVIVGSVVLPTLCGCTERTMENMEPNGEVVEVEVVVPDSTQQFSSQPTVAEDYSLHNLPDFQ